MTINTSFMTLGQSARLSAVTMIEVPPGRDLVTKPIMRDCAVTVGIEEPRYQQPALVALASLSKDEYQIEVHVNGEAPCYIWRVNFRTGSLESTGAMTRSREKERVWAELLIIDVMESRGLSLPYIIGQRILGSHEVPGYNQLISYLEAGHDFSSQFRAYFDTITGGGIA